MSLESLMDSNSNDLENLIKQENIISYNPLCVRKKSNWSVTSNEYKFDHEDFSPETLLKDTNDHSPKLKALLKKIKTLDANDYKKHGRLFKHFIFSDLKNGNYGAKLLASALIANGMTLGYTATPKKTTKKTDKRYGKLELLSDKKLLETEGENFYLLSSTPVFDQPISVITKKEILKRFNARDDNIYGKFARVIIMDSGFKEGIDLFDIKYIHIFEPSTVSADQKQVIGRGTRTCGQKGLEFHPTQGWPLHVFIYDLSIPEKLRGSFLNSGSTMDLFFKAMNINVQLINFASEIENTTIYGSVDYELNKNIHSFSIDFHDSDDEESLDSDDEFELLDDDSAMPIEGLRELGQRKAGRNGKLDWQNMESQIGGGPKLKIRNREPIVISKSQTEFIPLNFEQMRKYIQDHFHQYSWDAVKMENLCAQRGGLVRQIGGGPDLIKYTPTQDFVRNYFTSNNPLKGMLLFHSVGTGKCHAKDTPIIMYDGSIKMVQDICVGDKLMGDDSTPREVLSLAQGKDDLYDIIPVKGDKYTVNSEHILCLKPTRLGAVHISSQKNYPYSAKFFKENGKISAKSFKTKEEAELFLDDHHSKNPIIEIPVNEYLKLSSSSRKNLKGYRTGVDFETKTIDFDPYIIGFWLGDGSKRGPVFTTQDAKVLYYLFKELPKYNLTLNYQSGYDYRVSSVIPRGENILLKALQKYNLINNKHIPNDYKINDRNNRLLLLAGLIDSDGCKDNAGIEITQKNKILAEDIVFLCRSLGFAAYIKECEKSCTYKGEKKTGTYYRIHISGDELIDIPVKIDRKRVEERKQKKSVLVTGIEVSWNKKGDYYGFTLDGNNRYLLGDFTVTHNTCSAIAAATNTFEKDGYTILWVTRHTLKNDIWKNMFDQVCNENIRTEIENHYLKIPADQNKRMRLLSKSWKIRPMSYKQFSNLVSKKNDYYKKLVQINGELDPLRKTLLIIDEAHKLYGGGDLSNVERPDMNALHKSLMSSYTLSGRDSVKLLLMTATPMTDDPMEIIKLLNLLRPIERQIPDDFNSFSTEYLNEHGQFTEIGRHKYLDDIAGYVSYLNRERDARQFAQPIVKHVHVPITEDIESVERFDKKIVRDLMNTDILHLKTQIVEKNKTIQGELSEADKNMFSFLKEETCGDLEGKPLKLCEKVTKANIKELVQEAKAEIKKIREQIKEIRELIKNRNLLRNTALNDVKENVANNEENFERYKQSVIYNMKNKCGKKISGKIPLKELAENDPQTRQYSEDISAYNNKIAELQDLLKTDLENHKKRIDHLKKILKKDLSELESSVIKMTIVDERKAFKTVMKIKKRDATKTQKDIKKQIGVLEKSKKKRFHQLKKTVKNMANAEKKKEKGIARAEKKLRKTMRKQGELRDEIKHDLLVNLVDKYRSKIKNDLVGVNEEIHHKQMEKENTRLEKQKEKEKAKEDTRRIRAEEKENLRKTKKALKEKEKQDKKEEKTREAERKAREKQETKERTKREKSAKKTHKKLN